MKVTRKIPALSVHLMGQADSKTAESADLDVDPPSPVRPSSSRTSSKKRSRPSGSQDKPADDSGQAQASARPEREGISQLAGLNLQEGRDAKTVGGKGRGSRTEGEEPVKGSELP